MLADTEPQPFNKSCYLVPEAQQIGALEQAFLNRGGKGKNDKGNAGKDK